jgi:hypothetical protein
MPTLTTPNGRAPPTKMSLVKNKHQHVVVIVNKTVREERIPVCNHHFRLVLKLLSFDLPASVCQARNGTLRAEERIDILRVIGL